MALDNNTGDSLFGNLKKTATHSTEIKEEVPQHTIEYIEENTAPNEALAPKWQQLDKVTTLLTTEQKEGLDRIAKRLMKVRVKALKGSRDKERITANTLMRALIDNFLSREHSVQIPVLNTEEDVRRWISELFK